MPTIDSNVTTEAALISAITTFNDETAAGSYTIDITGAITETADLAAIDNATAGVSLVIDGGGQTLDGGGAHRGFFILAGDTTIENLVIQNATVTGGAGGNGAIPGGGAAFGGGLFVAGTYSTLTTGGTATLIGTSFQDDAVLGGNGGTYVAGGEAGAGGAMGGAGGLGHFGVGGSGGTPGGYGGGNSGSSGSGVQGGKAGGADIFVQTGGVLRIESGTLGAGTYLGGYDGPPVDGRNNTGGGSAIFLEYGGGPVTLDPAPGETDDMAGNVVTWGLGETVGNVVVLGGGTALLDADSIYGSLTIEGGSTVVLGALGAEGEGAVAFAGTDDTLRLAPGVSLDVANPLYGDFVEGVRSPASRPATRSTSKACRSPPARPPLPPGAR